MDCVFPANFSESDAEVYLVIRTADKDHIGQKQDLKVAINEGNVNYERILEENYSGWKTEVYPDIDACLQAVADGKADVVLITSFRYNSISKQCEGLGLTPIATGIGVEYSFVVARGNAELYSVMNKTVNMVPQSKFTSVMMQYIAEAEKEMTFREFAKAHMTEFIAIVAGVLLVILALALRTIHVTRRALRNERLIASAETDALTGLYNRHFLFEHADRMRAKTKKKPMDAIALDIERFHSVNALNGQETGDKVLSSLAQQIRRLFDEKDSVAGRIEADRFCIFRWHKWHEDDFGTGYSSLGMLSSMPIDILKIARSFIMNMSNSAKDIRLVKLILDLAKEMGLAVIAKGVENKVELMRLQSMGCDLVQGYYFSRPLPAAEYEELIRKSISL